MTGAKGRRRIGFEKSFHSNAAMRRCQQNHAFFRWLDAPRTPRLLAVDEARQTLIFERVAGGPVADTVSLIGAAVALGEVHGRWSRATDPSRRFPGEWVSPFQERRRQLANERLRGLTAGERPEVDLEADLLWARWDTAATSLYKDSNATNILVVAGGGLHWVDFDSLTRAPAGYDLAKLVLTYAMRGGDMSRSVFEKVCDRYASAYRKATGQEPTEGWTRSDLEGYLALHWVLTYPYAEKNGYLVRWPAIWKRLAR